MTMEKIDNDVNKVVRSGPTSQLVANSVEVTPSSMVSIRGKYQSVPEDTLDWSSRRFSINEMLGSPTGLELSPSGTLDGSYMMNHILPNLDILACTCKKYWALKYDYMDVNFTFSSPKSLVGGIHVGWFPYQDYYDKNSAETCTEIFGKPLLLQGLINGPYTHATYFGMSKDITFTIPWSYKYPIMSTFQLCANDESSPGLRAPYGTPILWWKLLENTGFVNTVHNPVQMHIWVQFRGLQWFGPTNQGLVDLVHKQSGLEEMAVAAVADMIGNEVVNVGGDFADMMLPREYEGENAEDGTYDLPQTVQLAYCGDTSSIDYPNTSPIFYEPKKTKIFTPSVSEMLSRPQYLGSFTTATGTPTTLSNNPLCFQAPGGILWNKATYFRWFGMLNRYWRGTVCFHIVVAGHPMVEVQLSSIIKYPFFVPQALQTTADVTKHVSVFSGTKMIIVHIPFLSYDDYKPIYDAYPDDDIVTKRFYTAIVELKATISSTMLDVVPIIPCYIYVSAGADFAYYQPLPPGLYNPVLADLVKGKGEKEKEKITPKRKKRIIVGTKRPPGIKASKSWNQWDNSKEKKTLDEQIDRVTKQVFIPLETETEHMQSRHGHTSDPGTMINLPTVYDYMKIWSRAIPFYDYNNDGDQEPIPDPDVGLKCASWYTPVDRSADLNVNNSWYMTLDYIAYFSMQFVYYQGSIGFKVVICKDSGVRSQGGYVYVSLAGPDENYRQKTHVPWEYDDAQVPPESNFGAGVVLTPIEQQPILEFTVPYRGSNTWSYTNNNAYYRPQEEDWVNANASVANNIVLLKDNSVEYDVLADAMFRKIGSDFVLGVETILPPPTMWIARGFDWQA